jgi:hypothetical protein
VAVPSSARAVAAPQQDPFSIMLISTFSYPNVLIYPGLSPLPGLIVTARKSRARATQRLRPLRHGSYLIVAFEDPTTQRKTPIVKSVSPLHDS